MTLAEHLISLAEGKPKKVGKTTYKSLNDLIMVVKKSGYVFNDVKVENGGSTPSKKNNAAPLTNGKIFYFIHFIIQ